MPKRRPGQSKTKNTSLNMERILMLVEGMEVFNPYKNYGPFETYEEMQETFKDHKEYIINLFIYGDDDGTLGGFGVGFRPAGWWYCESPIKDYIKEGKHSGIIGDNVYLDGQYYEELKKYAVENKYRKSDPHQFKLNQHKYLKENDLYYKWELQEIAKNGVKSDWITRQSEKL